MQSINRNSSILQMSEEEDVKFAFVDAYEDSDLKNASDFIQGSNSARNHYKPD